MNHLFPSKVTLHVITFEDGAKRDILVSPSETFGKALARLGISPDRVYSVTLPESPLNYEPDWLIASR